MIALCIWVIAVLPPLGFWIWWRVNHQRVRDCILEARLTRATQGLINTRDMLEMYHRLIEKDPWRAGKITEKS